LLKYEKLNFILHTENHAKELAAWIHAHQSIAASAPRFPVLARAFSALFFGKPMSTRESNAEDMLMNSRKSLDSAKYRERAT
jgi:hypothetical protein